jgi:hypothetical protein
MIPTSEQTADRLREAHDADRLTEVYADHDRWQKRADSARDRITRAERTLESCDRHLGVRVVTEAFRDLLAGYFPGHTLEVLGPFGLGHEISIHVQDGNRTSIAGVRFRPRSGNRLHLVDTYTTTGDYPTGSLGSINGLNHPDGDEPATIADVVAELDHQVHAHERWVNEQQEGTL